MVGCKDDPSHKLTSLAALQPSPTLDQQHVQVAHWLHTVSQPSPISPISLLPANSIPNKVQIHQAPDPLSVAHHHHHLNKHACSSANTQSKKRKALADLDPSLPRKSARLTHKQSESGYKMSTSRLKEGLGRKNAREGARDGTDEDEAKADMGRIITRGRAQVDAQIASSSNKENGDITRDTVAAFTGTTCAEFSTPTLQPNAIIVPPDLGSQPKRKHFSSRPPSPKESTSTRSSNVPTQVNKKERLTLLNPPVKFLSPAYLSKLGNDIKPLVLNLWVDHIISDDKGYIPQALQVRRLSSFTKFDTDAHYWLRRECLSRLQINQSQRFARLVLQPIPDTAEVIMREYG